MFGDACVGVEVGVFLLQCHAVNPGEMIPASGSPSIASWCASLAEGKVQEHALIAAPLPFQVGCKPLSGAWSAGPYGCGGKSLQCHPIHVGGRGQAPSATPSAQVGPSPLVAPGLPIHMPSWALALRRPRCRFSSCSCSNWVRAQPRTWVGSARGEVPLVALPSVLITPGSFWVASLGASGGLSSVGGPAALGRGG